jgi:hypothetical protein
MDQIPLVEEQIADGRRFLARLGEVGFPVTAAAWVRETERWRPHLYVVTPLEDEGSGDAYVQLFALMRQMPQPFSLDPLFDVMALGRHEPLAEALLDLQRRHPGRSSFHFGGTQFGGVEVEDVYLYPPVAVADQTDREVSEAK